MNVQYTKEQQEAVKNLCLLAGRFSDHLMKVMLDYELDKTDGCVMYIRIEPSAKLTQECVMFGSLNEPAGHVSISRGVYNDQYEPFGCNSPEYEKLFMDMKDNVWAEPVRKKEKPLPPDGLWIGASTDFPAPVVTKDGKQHGNSIQVGYQYGRR